jgi:hypothetical protein
MMERFKYSGAKLKEISFPLGGIGSGCVGLSGTGRLVDWEICNRPNKNSLNGFSHFAVKVEEGGRVVDARVLNSDLPSPYTGGESNYGFGPSRFLLAGAPHFRDAVFTGTYPVARIDFSDDTFPGQAALEAFNPMIPLDADASSLPVACFTVHLTNTTGRALDYVLAFSVNNFLPKGKRFNTHLQAGLVHLVRQQSTWADPDDPDFGELVFSVRGERVSWQEDWYRGSWFDSLATFWRDFTAPGDMKNRRGTWRHARKRMSDGHADNTPDPAAGRKRPGPVCPGLVFPQCDQLLESGKTGSARSVAGGSRPFPAAAQHLEKQLRRVVSGRIGDQSAHAGKLGSPVRETPAFVEASMARRCRSGPRGGYANLSLLSSPLLRLRTAPSSALRAPCHAAAARAPHACLDYAYALPFLYTALERSMLRTRLPL